MDGISIETANAELRNQPMWDNVVIGHWDFEERQVTDCLT